MTITRRVIIGELPPAKTTTPEQRAFVASTRYCAEWETPEGVCDVPDPLWGATGFGPTGHDAYVDLIANTAHDRRGQTDEELYSLLAGHVLVLREAAERADHYAAGAFNSATSTDGADAEALIKLGQTWTQTAATLRRMPEPESTKPPPQTLTVEHDAGAPPEAVRALGELFLAMPPEVKRSQTFGLSMKGSDGRHVMAVVATRDPSRLAEFVRLGLIEPASDTPLSDCPQHIADELTDEVTFTAPDGRMFTGSPADVGVEVAEALLKHDGETWWLPSVIRDHAVEHINRVLDVLRWDLAGRLKAARAALHLYCLNNAESDEDRAQRLAALDAMLDNTMSQEKTTRQPGESDEQLRARIMAGRSDK